MMESYVLAIMVPCMNPKDSIKPNPPTHQNFILHWFFICISCFEYLKWRPAKYVRYIQ